MSAANRVTTTSTCWGPRPMAGTIRASIPRDNWFSNFHEQTRMQPEHEAHQKDSDTRRRPSLVRTAPESACWRAVAVVHVCPEDSDAAGNPLRQQHPSGHHQASEGTATAGRRSPGVMKPKGGAMVAMRRDAVVNHDSTARSGLCARGECGAIRRCRRKSGLGPVRAGRALLASSAFAV